jgi:hypothetical protein
LRAGEDQDLVDLNLNLHGGNWGKQRRLNERCIFYLNFTLLQFSNIKKGGVNKRGVKVFGSARLEEKIGVLGLELLCLDRKDIYIAEGSISGVDIEQIQ